jgi:hypothetical protein
MGRYVFRVKNASNPSHSAIKTKMRRPDREKSTNYTTEQFSNLLPQYRYETKKADVIEHVKVFGHVGLLVNQPPGIAELLFI